MTNEPASDVTLILDEVRLGVPGAADRLAAVVYQELHRIAERAMRRESEGHTLQPTELVNEAFVKLVGQRGMVWQNRAQASPPRLSAAYSWTMPGAGAARSATTASGLP